MASFPTSKLVNPDINDFKQFEKEVKDKYDIDKFNATEPYEIHIVGSSRLLEDLDSVQELRRYSQDLDAIMALYHLDSEMTEEEAIDDMGTEEWLIRADEMQPGFLQNRASFMIDDMDDVEEEPQINRRFGSFQNYLEEDWRTMMEGYDPQVFTKRFNAEVENMEPALNALETAEEVVRESEDHRFESVGFNMNVGYDHLDGAYDILKDTANAELTYEYLPEDQNAVLLVTRNGISSQRHKGNPGGWDTELAEKVKRRFQ